MEIKSSTIWNILTILTLIATAVVIFVYGITFLFPNNPLNFFAPEKPPAVVVLPSSTPTLIQLPPTITLDPNLFATATTRPSVTPSSTLESMPPTSTRTITTVPATATNIPTVTGTPPTVTPSPTFTIPPASLTSWAQTSAAKTKAVEETQAAQDLTATAAKQTQDVYTQQTEQAQQTQTVLAYGTATSAAATSTQQLVNTQSAETTRTQQAVIEDNNPIAYSNTGGDVDAEWFITKKPSSGAAGATLYELSVSGSFANARPVSSWWLGDTNNHYLLFSDPLIASPIHRMLYTTTATVEQIGTTGLSGEILQPSVNLQAGTAADRTVVFTSANTPGLDRNLWTVQGHGTGNGGTFSQISNDATRDDHDPGWVNTSLGGFNGQVLFVTGIATGPENIYVMTPSLSAYPGSKLTFYDVSTTEITSPRWCYGYNWTTEESYNVVVYAMRTSGTDDWDLYSIDPSVQITNGNNEAVTVLTTSAVDETQPDWSPFCNRITYLSNSGGQWDIWTMNANGTNQAKLTNDGEIEARPLWMPYKDGMTMP